MFALSHLQRPIQHLQEVFRVVSCDAWLHKLGRDSQHAREGSWDLCMLVDVITDC